MSSVISVVFLLMSGDIGVGGDEGEDVDDGRGPVEPFGVDDARSYVGSYDRLFVDIGDIG